MLAVLSGEGSGAAIETHAAAKGTNRNDLGARGGLIACSMTGAAVNSDMELLATMTEKFCGAIGTGEKIFAPGMSLDNSKKVMTYVVTHLDGDAATIGIKGLAWVAG